MLLQKQASYLRGEDAKEMHEEIKRKVTKRDSISIQLDAIRKSQKDRIAALTRTFGQMVDEAVVALERKTPLYQIEKIDPDIESINNRDY